MTISLDFDALRNATATELVAQLKHAASSARQSDGALQQVTDDIVAATVQGSIPCTVAQAWLSVSHDPTATATCLRQPQSALLRRVAVKRWMKDLRRASTLAPAWDAVGGASGLADIMADLSVWEVGSLCSWLGWAATRGEEPLLSEKRRRVTELLLLLLSAERNRDQRPLIDSYLRLLRACDSQYVWRWVDVLGGNEADASMVARIKDELLPDARSAGFGTESLLIKDRSRFRTRIMSPHWHQLKHRALDKILASEQDKVDLSDFGPLLGKDTEFSIFCLQKLVESEVLLRIRPRAFVDILALPLVRRVQRKRSAPDVRSRVGRLINQCLERNSTLRTETVRRLSNCSVANALVGLWGSNLAHPDNDDILATMLQLLPSGPAGKDLWLFLNSVPLRRRYDLLRLAFSYMDKPSFDIGPPTAKSHLRLPKGKLVPSYVFETLPPELASSLFERLLAGHSGSSSFIEPSGKGDQFSAFRSDLTQARPCVARAVLIRRTNPTRRILPDDPDKIIENLKTNELSLRKAKATESKDPIDRAHWARAALKLCMAIGDLELYEKTLRWAGTRFVRDPMVINSMFDASLLVTPEAQQMLAVIPEKPTAIADLEVTMRKATRVVMTLFEIAAMAQREPSFQSQSWINTLLKYEDIVQLRLKRVDAFQRRLGLSDEEVFQDILKPTLDMVLEAEQFFLREGHEGLGWQSPAGICNFLSFPRNPSSNVLKFLDCLAQRRNELWKEYRARLNPEVITLPAPWPLGLPIQCLVPRVNVFMRRSDLPYGVMPYIQRQAEAIVFGDPEALNAPVSRFADEKAAIGMFVDSWMVALRLWLIGAENESDRDARALKAWKFATEKLRGGERSQEEAERLWYYQIEPGTPYCQTDLWKGLVDVFPESLDRREPAKLPEPDASAQPVEWNPDSSWQSSDVTDQDRKLPPVVCLNCMLDPRIVVGQGWKMANSISLVQQPTTRTYLEPRSYFQLTRPDWHKAGVSHADATIVSAVLILNSRFGSSTSLLMKPLPSSSDQRFPALFLEESFLERFSRDYEGPLLALKELSDLVPSQLLVNLADSILQRIQDEENPNLRPYSILADVTRLIVSGDKPNLATPLIHKFIMENPDASSWHRLLLNDRVISRLDRKGAEDFFTSIIDATIDKLDAQAHATTASPETQASPPTGPPTSIIKVTTVKMIAQILRGSRVVSTTRAVDILAQLLDRAKHIDIRIAALQSLVSMMGSAEVNGRVLEQMRKYAVTLAGALDENKPTVTEEDWKQAEEEEGDLPEIPQWSDHRALTILMAGDYNSSPDLFSLAWEAMRVSGLNHKRWVLAFMKQQGFDTDNDVIQNLPAVPSDPSRYAKLFEKTDLTKISPYHFDVMTRYALLAGPPKEIRAVTEHVRDNEGLAESSAGRHWLRVWADPGDSNFFARKAAEFASLHRQGRCGPVTSDMVDAFLVKLVDIHLTAGNVKFLNDLPNTLKKPWDEQSHKLLEDRGPGLILRHLINRINALRTPEWQTNPTRQPTRLPDTLPFRLALMSEPPKDAPPDIITSYVKDLITLIEEIASSTNLPYQRHLDLIKEKLESLADHRLRMGVLLASPGNLSNPKAPTLADFLRVHIVEEMFAKWKWMKNDRDEDIADARAMVADWSQSVVEELRMSAMRLRDSIEADELWSPVPEWLFEDLGS